MQGKQLWVQWAIHMAYDPLDMLLWELRQPGKQWWEDGNIKHPQFHLFIMNVSIVAELSDVKYFWHLGTKQLNWQ